MKNLKYMTFILLSFFLLQATVLAGPVAIVVKARGNVQMVFGSSSKKMIVKTGTRLYSGSKIITQNHSFAAIKFLDDGSLVRIRPNSTCTVEAKRQKSSFFKNLFLEVGTIFSQIVKQKGVFRITTPTSVASVKGTAFWTKQEFKGGTYYYGEEGVVELSNKKGWALLRSGETGYVSSPNSRPVVRKSKKGEKPELDEDKTTIDEFELHFQNPKGESKSLRFKVKKQK
jgi:ferric-dicitrate binding protein FerR (iron transport regulator)